MGAPRRDSDMSLRYLFPEEGNKDLGRRGAPLFISLLLLWPGGIYRRQDLSS